MIHDSILVYINNWDDRRETDKSRARAPGTKNKFYNILYFSRRKLETKFLRRFDFFLSFSSLAEDGRTAIFFLCKNIM